MVDPAELEAAVVAGTLARGGGGGSAADGKAVRGAPTPDAPAPHLLAEATQQVPVVLTHCQIPGKTNELPHGRSTPR